MHWLDNAPSREIDPVLDCLAYLARQSDRPSSPVLLRAGLALSETGKLPFHQIEPALDQVGMRGVMIRRKLARWPDRQLPAILELDDETITLKNINATAPAADGSYTISDGGTTTVVVG